MLNKEVREEVHRIRLKDPRVEIESVFTQVIDPTIRVPSTIIIKVLF